MTRVKELIFANKIKALSWMFAFSLMYIESVESTREQSRQ